MHIASHGRIIGHEAVAVVTDAGTDDLPFSRGDVVCFESIVTCKRCRMCRQGNFNQCEKSRLVGLELDGLFTEFADVPASLAHCVNDLAGSDRDLEALACVEPAAVSYLACHNARINPGDSVVVLGAGPIGYYAALIAKTLFGAASVCVSEVSEFRREFVQRVSDQAVPPEVLHESDDQVDVLIDAAGAMSDVNRLIPRMYGNGRIVLLARTGQSLHIEHVDHVISKALRIIGSRGQLGGAFGTVLNLMRNGRIDPHLAVTRVVNGFDELATALQDPGRIVASDCKVVANLAE
jgi:threonine dehydrogenase-like Zn-dependent dehydrogenase